MRVAAQSAWTRHARETLARAGHRSGAARDAVMRTLDEATCCLSAHEVVERLRHEGRPVGTASVYRILERLDDLRLVHRIDIGDGIARYEPIEPGHRPHHHVVCTECGVVVPLEDEDVAAAVGAARPPRGFAELDRRLILRGRCVRCGRSARAG